MFYIMLKQFVDFLFTARCSNGDGKISDNIPEIYWNGNWYLLCGHCFENGTDGVRKFCNVLGYENGTIKRDHNVTYAHDAFFKGRCEENDTWPDCNGLCPVTKLGKKVSECATGQRGLQIECLGGFKPSNSSC